jgi:FtsH-binding integral membrane protein
LWKKPQKPGRKLTGLFYCPKFGGVMTSQSEHLAQNVLTIAHTATYGGSAVTVIGGLTLSEWGVIVGMMTAILGLVVGTLVNIWYKRQRLRLLRSAIESGKLGAAHVD